MVYLKLKRVVILFSIAKGTKDTLFKNELLSYCVIENQRTMNRRNWKLEEIERNKDRNLMLSLKDLRETRNQSNY